MGKPAGTPAELPTWIGLRPHRVWVGPDPKKKGVVYLRWYAGTNWKRRSLRFTLTGCSAAERKARERQAHEAAIEQLQRLTGKRAGTAPGGRQRALTLADAWAILAHPKTGKYASHSAVYRAELKKALADAAKYLGADFPWLAFDRVRLREITRTHAMAVARRGGVGFRPAQVLGTRMITMARVLHEEGRTPPDTVIPGGKEWIAELRAFCEAQRGAPLPPPHQPRYTLEEFRRLLAVAPHIDERFGLMFVLGAELRSGQVARTRRSHVDTAHWELTIHGKGKKGGTTILLTPDQRAALMAAMETGYLSRMEARHRADGLDYVLFPSELRPQRLAVDAPARFAVPEFQRTVGKGHVRDWVRAAEALAGISHVDGRAWYGARRQAVDGALDDGASAEMIENLGGWQDSRTPTSTYRDRGRRKVRQDAMGSRARVRGERPDPTE